MELRELGYFVTIAEEGSFTRGARRANVVQSTMSAAIGRLEHELGHAVFVRDPAGISLTPAGELLLGRARDILTATGALRTDLVESDGTLRGAVTIGTALTTGSFDLARGLAQLRSQLPHVRVRVHMSAAPLDEQLGKIADGTFDLALLPQPAVRPHGIELRTVGRLELLPVTGCDGPVPARRLSCDELARYPFVDFPVGWANRVRVDELFDARGLERDVVVEVVDPSTAFELVRGGIGVAFLPRSLVEQRDDVRVVAVDAPPLARVLVLARPQRPQHPAVRAAHDVLSNLAGPA